MRKEPVCVDEHANHGLRGGKIVELREIEVVCGRPMHYQASSDAWVCECGSTERAFDVVIERLTV